MFKKTSIAVVAGLMFAAPAAYADVSTEALVYQADQTNSLATINQVIVDATPQTAVILQLDGLASEGSGNIATVVQGTPTGDGGVTVDETGVTASNEAAEAAAPGAAEVVPYAAPDLTAYEDAQTGVAPYASVILGTDSNNYGLVYQDHQTGSVATIIQATGVESDTQAAAQNASSNGDIAANGGDIANQYADGTFAALLTDGVSGNEVTVTYGDANFTINYGLDDLTLSEEDTENSQGNVAIITQGANLTFASINENTVADDLADLFEGGDTSANQAIAIQTGSNGYVRIGQQGTLNGSVVFQKSDADGKNVAESYQYSSDLVDSTEQELSLISQVGNFNVAQVYQAGITNSSYVLQSGDGNVAVVDQLGTGAVAFVYQSNAAAGADYSTGNVASVYQQIVQ